ncbi:MAG: hypothetical protein CO137_00090 [Candidatus Magasanikbacteria bacterium CG_4_9_14_3_um_filter_32_9]|uniref:Uncharacterized protein n=1 Tax=Candidatus Magasanikbacteria bacterium CG_4_9_14_3_um_filter_32_9 TaxID=1974644 RepID=A0A2M7Z7U7_9BACT|nr:MAG: hypothetical protein CO137_00090 [Candidatus Magasanikbacteria bacterium CG_4_9_14_3_um_filter_32_9]
MGKKTRSIDLIKRVEQEKDVETLKLFLQLCIRLYDINLAIEVVKEFSGSLLELPSSFLNGLDARLQLAIARKMIEEIGIENARFIQEVYQNSIGRLVGNTSPVSINTLLKDWLHCNGRIFLTYPMETELCWNEELAKLFLYNCLEHSSQDNPEYNKVVTKGIKNIPLSWSENWTSFILRLNNFNQQDRLRNLIRETADFVADNFVDNSVCNTSSNAERSMAWHTRHNQERGWQANQLLEILLGKVTFESTKNLFESKQKPAV